MNRKKTFSESNDDITAKLIEYIKKLFESVQDKLPFLERNATKSSMVLPIQYTSEIARYICDTRALQQLESGGIINWCRNIRCLTPLPVEDDGNSLAHAVSIYIYGIQDKAFYFRQLIYSLMFMNQSPIADELVDRWKGDRMQVIRSIINSNPNYFEREEQKDWEYYLALCTMHRNRNGKLGQLEALHIFVLANVIARPIIVYAARGPTDEETVQGIRLEGIYLPLLRKENFERSPVLLAHNNGIFLPLFSAEAVDIQIWSQQPSPDSPHCAPLVRPDLTDIPVRFLLEKEKNIQDQFLEGYFDVVGIPLNSGNVKSVMLKFRPPPAQSIDLLWSMLAVINEYLEEDKALQYQSASQQFVPCVRIKIGACKGDGYGDPIKNNMCNGCYNEFLAIKSNTKRRNANTKPPSPPPSQPTLPIPKPRPTSITKCKNCRGKEVVLNGMCQGCYDDDVIRKYKERGQITSSPQGSKTICAHCGAPYQGHNEFALCPDCHKNLMMKQKDEERQWSPPTSLGAINGGAYAAAASGGDDNYSYNKKKVFCRNPGCEETLAPNSDDLCQKHLNELKKNRKKEICKFCNKNQADENNYDLCLNCLNDQQGILEEFEKKNSKPEILKQKNVNIGRGAVNIHDQHSIDMADDFLESLPMVTLPNQRNGINYVLSRQPVEQNIYDVPKLDHFQKPTVYEGYSSVPHNFGKQQGAVNWQRDIVSAPELPMPKHPDQIGIKCGNPDRPSCKNVVNNPNNFICDECIQEQREGFQNVKTGKQVNQQLHRPNTSQEQRFPQQPPQRPPLVPPIIPPPIVGQNRDPCKAFDCEYYGNPEFFGYCSNCYLEVSKNEKTGNRPQANEMPPVNHVYDVPAGVSYASYPPVTPPPAAQFAYPQTPPPLPTRQPEIFGCGVGGIQEQMECQNPECDMFGRPEWNGYCSQCLKRFCVERD